MLYQVQYSTLKELSKLRSKNCNENYFRHLSMVMNGMVYLINPLRSIDGGATYDYNKEIWFFDGKYIYTE